MLRASFLKGKVKCIWLFLEGDPINYKRECGVWYKGGSCLFKEGWGGRGVLLFHTKLLKVIILAV